MSATLELKLLGRLPLDAASGVGVGEMALHGKHVLVANNHAGLQVVDVSTPAAPKTVGSYMPKGRFGPIPRLAAWGEHAYVVEKDNRLCVLNLSDPAHLRVVGWGKFPVAAGNRIWGLAAAGKHVYVSLSGSLWILDVSNPAAPKEVAVCGGAAGLVTVAGDYAYLEASYCAMRIIDISDPASPREVGSFDGPGVVQQITVVETHQRAYLAADKEGLYIVDVSNLKAPRCLGRHGKYMGPVTDVAVAGKYALVATNGKLEAIDVSRPNRPKPVCSFSLPDTDTAWSVKAADGYVYTITDTDLFIFELGAPANPGQLASVCRTETGNIG